jgi:hypothetical protein
MSCDTHVIGSPEKNLRFFEEFLPQRRSGDTNVVMETRRAGPGVGPGFPTDD